MPSWILPRPGTEKQKHFQEICRTVLLRYMFMKENVGSVLDFAGDT